MHRLLTATALVAGFALSPVHAAIINIDLAGATTGTIINGVGADFAQTFVGQTVAGTGVTGSPTGALTLQAAGSIVVAAFSPVVSPAGNSLLSQPNNAAPLSILLDSAADSFAWTMGSVDSASSTLLASFFDAGGALVGSQVVAMTLGYQLYSVSGVGTFSGITFSNNTDPAGVRIMNMSYNAVDVGAVPEPGSLALVGLALVAAALGGRKAVARKA